MLINRLAIGVIDFSISPSGLSTYSYYSTSTNNHSRKITHRSRFRIIRRDIPRSVDGAVSRRRRGAQAAPGGAQPARRSSSA